MAVEEEGLRVFQSVKIKIGEYRGYARGRALTAHERFSHSDWNRTRSLHCENLCVLCQRKRLNAIMYSLLVILDVCRNVIRVFRVRVKQENIQIYLMNDTAAAAVLR